MRPPVETPPFNRTIELPDREEPQTLEASLRGALYAASMYHWPTLIKIGHREGVLLSREDYDRMLALAQARIECGDGQPAKDSDYRGLKFAPDGDEIIVQ